MSPPVDRIPSDDRLPAAADVVVIGGGIIGVCADSTPDTLPVISAVGNLPGFFLATGFSGHGFGIGPAAGRSAADVVFGDTPLVDPAGYGYER